MSRVKFLSKADLTCKVSVWLSPLVSKFSRSSGHWSCSQHNFSGTTEHTIDQSNRQKRHIQIKFFLVRIEAESAKRHQKYTLVVV